MRCRAIRSRVPPFLKSWARIPLDAMREVLETVSGARDALTPPRRLRVRFVSSIPILDFKAAGQTYRHFFIELCGLKPDEAILEVGSGCGRIAAALTGHLKGCGRYEGLEIVAAGVQWCRAAITPRFLRLIFTSPMCITGTTTRRACIRRKLTGFHLRPHRLILYSCPRCLPICRRTKCGSISPKLRGC